MTPSTTPQFSLFKLPSGESAWIPADVNLRFPDKTSIDPHLLHFLIYIPWEDKYIEQVDMAYRNFFQAVLPYLHVRTTDVHIATCAPFIKELIRADHETVDEQVVHLAFILHDSGWSQMSELEIAESLGVKGLALSGEAVTPKARHVELGKQIAQRVLSEYPVQPPLTDEQKDLIYKAILYHDKPEELLALGGIPASVRVVCDVDHLWSFTHENFWQDTVRKGVNPRVYLENLSKDLDGYFVAEPGRQKARQMLEVRGSEVKSWEDWVRGNPQE
jgi:hypothetical protein